MERIICSAIKFKRSNDNTWCIYTGLRHSDCLYRMYLDHIEYEKGSEVQGFMTDKDRFVDRFEGLKIAKKSKQYHETNEYTQLNSLYSEDVWPEGQDEIYKREPRN